MKVFLLVGVMLLAGCAGPHRSLSESTRICELGHCSKTPLLMMVLGFKEGKDLGDDTPIARPNKLIGFTFVGWTQYDGNIKTSGPKFLAYHDLDGQTVCKGFYDWSGFGRVSDAELTCFDTGSSVKGKIRNFGRQTRGRFRGKGVGTGVMSFDGGLITFIYGVDPPELKSLSYKQIWAKYGGDPAEIPLHIPPRRKRVPGLRDTVSPSPNNRQL